MNKWNQIKYYVTGAAIMIGSSCAVMAGMLYYYHLRGII